MVEGERLRQFTLCLLQLLSYTLADDFMTSLGEIHVSIA